MPMMKIQQVLQQTQQVEYRHQVHLCQLIPQRMSTLAIFVSGGRTVQLHNSKRLKDNITSLPMTSTQQCFRQTNMSRNTFKLTSLRGNISDNRSGIISQQPSNTTSGVSTPSGVDNNQQQSNTTSGVSTPSSVDNNQQSNTTSGVSTPSSVDNNQQSNTTSGVSTPSGVDNNQQQSNTTSGVSTPSSVDNNQQSNTTIGVSTPSGVDNESATVKHNKWIIDNKWCRQQSATIKQNK